MHAGILRSVVVLAVSSLLHIALSAQTSSSALSLSRDVPDQIAANYNARALAAATHAGLQKPDLLGSPWLLLHKGRVDAVLLSGRFNEARDGSENATCFLAVFRSETDPGTILPTFGKGRPASEACQGLDALGLLPSGPGIIHLGILYSASLPDKSTSVPFVFTWKLGDPPAIDTRATNFCQAAAPETIADMRKPDCGRKVLHWE